MPIVLIANDNLDKLERTRAVLHTLLEKEPAAKDYSILTAASIEEGIAVVERCQRDNLEIDIAALDAHMINSRQTELSRSQIAAMLECFGRGGKGISHFEMHRVVQQAYPEARRIYWSGGLEGTTVFGIKMAPANIDMADSLQHKQMAHLIRDWIVKPETRRLPFVTPETLEERYPFVASRNETATLLGLMRKGLPDSGASHR